jgi:site-specific DNA-methyltransferase (adenine-specific)
MAKLLHGDCLELMKSIPNKSIDMILCDLPYGTTACKWDVVIPFEPLWKEYKRIIKDRGCIALFGSEPFSSHLRMSNIKDYKYDWVWNKKKGGNIFLSKYQPNKITEIISIFNAGLYFPIMEKRDKIKTSKNYGTGETMGGNRQKENKLYTYTHRYPKNIIEISNADQKGKQHPTAKPVSLLEYLIKTYTLENEAVLDNCMGSGSTGVACINTNRNFIGIEKDETYFKIAEKRIDEAQEKKKELLFA